MAIELDNTYKAGLIEQKDYLVAKLILQREHEIEEKDEKKHSI